MERNGDNQGDDPDRGRIECGENLLRHEIDAGQALAAWRFLPEALSSFG